MTYASISTVLASCFGLQTGKLWKLNLYLETIRTVLDGLLNVQLVHGVVFAQKDDVTCQVYTSHP